MPRHFVLRHVLLVDPEPEIRLDKRLMVVPRMVECSAKRLHGAVHRPMRDKLLERPALLILAGAALRRHHTPLIADLGDFRLRNLVEVRVSAEDASYLGQFPYHHDLEWLAADDFAHIEFSRFRTIDRLKQRIIVASGPRLECSRSSASRTLRIENNPLDTSIRMIYIKTTST
jgi:hypothetical protein